MDKAFRANREDVVSMDATKSLISNPTFKLSQFAEALKKKVGDPFGEWFGDGVECEFLGTTSATGWRTGKIRIRFEFVPDVPDDEIPAFEEDSESEESPWNSTDTNI